MRSRQPLIFAVKGNALDDGPGIRSVVFFKGCPLSCTWCHNPESKRQDVEISYDVNACIRCDSCIEICPELALDRANPYLIDRSNCNLCFACEPVCPTGALSRVGNAMTVDEVLTAVLKDKPFFDPSGGGVTLSGGEATLFSEYLSELLIQLKSAGIHTLLETCGLFNMAKFDRDIYPWVDLIYFDIKLIDSEAHYRYCGADNEAILRNFEILAERAQANGVPLLPRIPLVPGITATVDNLQAAADFLLDCGCDRVALLPYHPTWREKEKKLGLVNSRGEKDGLEDWLSNDALQECQSLFIRAGLEVI